MAGESEWRERVNGSKRSAPRLARYSIAPRLASPTQSRLPAKLGAFDLEMVDGVDVDPNVSSTSRASLSLIGSPMFSPLRTLRVGLTAPSKGGENDTNV